MINWIRLAWPSAKVFILKLIHVAEDLLKSITLLAADRVTQEEGESLSSIGEEEEEQKEEEGEVEKEIEEAVKNDGSLSLASEDPGWLLKSSKTEFCHNILRVILYLMFLLKYCKIIKW